MADFPFLPIATDAFIGDTQDLTAQEVGVYFLLLMAAWRTSSCSLPDDDTRLARMARVDRRTWTRRMRPLMLRFWMIQDGEWTQKKLTKMRLRTASMQMGGRPKGLGKNTTGENNHNHNHKTPDSKESGVEQPQERAHGRQAKTQLTDVQDWVPDQSDLLYAEEYRQDPNRILQDIRDWAANAPPSKRRKKDPHAFWRGWVRREADKATSKSGGRGRSDADEIRSAAQRFSSGGSLHKPH